MKLVIALALSIGMQLSSLLAPSLAAGSTVSAVRIGGWIGNDALLVLPDRSAGSAAIGGSFAGAKLVEIGDTSYTIEFGGSKGKNTLDPAWQLAPHPDLTNWLVSYMKSVGLRLDAQNPDLSQSTVVHISQNGAVKSQVIKVEQANPFGSLPDWMESIDLKVTLTPHEATQVQFLSMKITQPAYERLLKSPITVQSQAQSK